MKEKGKIDLKYKKLSKNTILFAFSGIGTKVIIFFLVPFFTYVLNTKEYGTVELISTTVSILTPVLTLNVQDAVLRFSMDNQYSPKQVLMVSYRIQFIAGVIAGIALLALYFGGILCNRTYLFFVYVLFVFGMMNNSITMYLKATDKVLIMVVAGMIYTLLYGVLSIIFLVVFRWGIFGYLSAMSLSLICSVVFMFMFGKAYGLKKVSPKRGLLRNMLTYSIPLMINSLSWWLNEMSDRYLVTLFCGMASNGIYSVAYKVPAALSFIQNIFYNAWSISAITEFDAQDTDGFIGTMYTLYSGACCVIASVILIFNVSITSILYAKEYWQTWKYVPFLLVGTVFYGIALFEGCIFASKKKTKEVARSTIIGAVFNVMLNIILIFNMGVMGAAIATMTGYIITWGVRSFSLLRIVNMKVNWKKQLGTYFFLIIQSVVATCGKNTFIQICLFIFIIVLQRDLFQRFFKRFRAQ